MPQKLEIDDFSGGVTDYYLNAPANKLKACDNLLLIQYPESGKPYTRPGSTFHINAANAQLPVGAQRISTMKNVDGTVLVQSSGKLYYSTGSAWSEVQGPSASNAFKSTSTLSRFIVTDVWQHQTLWAHSGYINPVRVRNTGSGFVAEAAGMPKVLGFTNTGGFAASNTWLYKAVRKYTYTTQDNITFIERSEPTAYLQANSAGTPNNFTFSSLVDPPYAAYNLAAIKVEIYRTINNGTTFYYAGEVSDSAGAFVDTISDVFLQLNEPLYTTGGVLPNGVPPRCAVVHMFGDIAYYANTFDGTAYTKYRIYHSIPGAIGAVPPTNYLDLDDEIVGLSSTRSNVVAICRNGAVYRIDGIYDELGRGGMQYERIADAATCISSQSVVQALDGLFWAGQDGIYFTDGFNVTRMNADYDRTWKTWVSTVQQQQRIQGKYDKRKNRVWWSVQTDASPSADVDKCYVLDLNYGVRANATFTTVSGLASFSPTALEFTLAGDLVRADRRGYVFQHSDVIYTDPRVDVTVAPSAWAKQTIFYDLESTSFNFGTSYLRKYVTGINVVADSLTNLSLQITSDNDDGKSVADLSPVRYRGALVWGEPDVYWGDPAITWDLDGLILEKRRMPAKNLRCSYKNIRFTNAYVVIQTSAVLGTVDIDAAAKTATLTNTASFDWPDNAVDWFLSFEQDGYTADYRVTARTADVLTYDDPFGQSQGALGSKWELKGYPKGEVFNLLNYCLHYEIFGQTQDVFNTADTGAVE